MGRYRRHARAGRQHEAALGPDDRLEGSHYPYRHEPGASGPAFRRDAAARLRPDARQDRLVWPRRAGEHGDSRGLAHRNARAGSRLTARMTRRKAPQPRSFTSATSSPTPNTIWGNGNYERNAA